MLPVVHRHKIPLATKLACSSFLAVLVRAYWNNYAPAKFLWCCAAALIFSVMGMGLASSLLISMCTVDILLPRALWLADFGGQLLGLHFWS